MQQAGRIAYFRRTGGSLDVLLTLQSGQTRGPSGKSESRIWKLPGSTCRSGESHREAALRGFATKTGFELPVSHRYFEHFVYKTSATYEEYVYLAFDREPLDRRDTLPHRSLEIECVRWFTLDDVKNFTSSSITKNANLGGAYWRYIMKMQNKFAPTLAL